MTDYKPKERQDLEELYRKQNVRIYELEEENKKLKEKIKRLEFDVDAWHQLKLLLEWEIEKLKAENEYLHKLLPEADGYAIEKQLEKRVRNDGEEDVYE